MPAQYVQPPAVLRSYTKASRRGSPADLDLNGPNISMRGIKTARTWCIMIDMLGVVMLQRQHHECHWYHLLISKWLSSATAQGSASLPYALTSAWQGPRGMSSMRCAESRSVLAAACRSVMEDAERRCHRRPPEAATGPCRSVPRAPQRKLWLGVQLCRRPSAQCRLRDSRPSRRGGLLITLIT